MDVMDGKEAAKIFRRAARKIEERGWTQHDREGIDGLTLDLALCESTHGFDMDRLFEDQHTSMCDEIFDRLLGWMLLTRTVPLPTWRPAAVNILITWNDDPKRTGAEVLRALRSAAGLVAEAEREAAAGEGD